MVVGAGILDPASRRRGCLAPQLEEEEGRRHQQCGAEDNDAGEVQQRARGDGRRRPWETKGRAAVRTWRIGIWLGFWAGYHFYTPTFENCRLNRRKHKDICKKRKRDDHHMDRVPALWIGECRFRGCSRYRGRVISGASVYIACMHLRL
jgi:hypothetical protein